MRSDASSGKCSPRPLSPRAPTSVIRAAPRPTPSSPARCGRHPRTRGTSGDPSPGTPGETLRRPRGESSPWAWWCKRAGWWDLDCSDYAALRGDPPTPSVARRKLLTPQRVRGVLSESAPPTTPFSFTLLVWRIDEGTLSGPMRARESARRDRSRPPSGRARPRPPSHHGSRSRSRTLRLFLLCFGAAVSLPRRCSFSSFISL